MIDHLSTTQDIPLSKRIERRAPCQITQNGIIALAYTADRTYPSSLTWTHSWRFLTAIDIRSTISDVVFDQNSRQ